MRQHTLQKIDKIEKKFTAKKNALGFLGEVEGHLKALFPETKTSKIYPGEKIAGAHLSQMLVSVTETFNNAINSRQFPIGITLERRGNSLFCFVKENGTFKNPKEITMPHGKHLLDENGRGWPFTYMFSGKKIKFEGEIGKVTLEYVFGKDADRDKLIALSKKGKLVHMKPLVEPLFTYQIMAA